MGSRPRCPTTHLPSCGRSTKGSAWSGSGAGHRGGTIIRSLEELRGLLERDLFDGLTHGRGTCLVATLLKDGVTPGEVPDVMRWLDRTHGKDITTRTWLTVQRIVRKLESL